MGWWPRSRTPEPLDTLHPVRLIRSLRVVSWNCRRASAESGVWSYLLGLEPDLALLQEVSGVPTSVKDRFSVQIQTPIGQSGEPQRFHTVTLLRGAFIGEKTLETPFEWANAELARFAGNVCAWEVEIESYPLNIVNAYIPAWPVDRSRLAGIDTSSVRLTLNRDLWVGDLLLSALRFEPNLGSQPWLVAGDFNLSETFDEWSGGPHGNREYLDRMQDLGLTECLRAAQGELTPTFRNPRGGQVLHQIDHVFASPPLVAAPFACVVADQEEVFGSRLSDHLPIVADLSVGE